jgi:hypothetical protein
MNAVTTVSLCSLIFVLGLMSDYYFGRNADNSMICLFLYRLLPNWQHFWLVDALGDGGIIPLVYILKTGVYTVTYTAGVLLLGMFSFRHAEIQ